MNIEELLRQAGRRAAPAAIRRERARRVVHDAWREAVGARLRRRRIMIALPLLAAAAALIVVAVAQFRRGPATAALDIAGRVVGVSGVLMLSDGAGSRRVSIGAIVPEGARLETGAGDVATFEIEGGGELRMNGATSARFLAGRRFDLAAGQIYLDSGASTGGAPLAVETFAGVVRDVGTRFEVAIRDGNLRVRVRDGAARLDATSGQYPVTAGGELTTNRGGEIVVRSAPTYGADWDWLLRATRFRLEGATLTKFLSWIEAEGGRQVKFADANLREAVGGTVLHGSIEGLTVEEALAAVLPVSGLSYRLEGARVVIDRRPAGAGR